MRSGAFYTLPRDRRADGRYTQTWEVAQQLMKVSMLCGAHYEGAAAHLNRPPVAPSICDPVVAKQSFDHLFSSGQNPSEDVKHSLELFGREVLPRIRDVGAELRESAAAGGAA